MFGFNADKKIPTETPLVKKIKNTATAGFAGLMSLTASVDSHGQEVHSSNLDEKNIESTMPSRQDSLDLLNNKREILYYYRNHLLRDYNSKKMSQDDFKNFENNKKQSSKEVSFKSTNPKDYQTIKPEDYYKNIDQNNFLAGEELDTVLDVRAPMQIFDRRIVPTEERNFFNNIPDDPFYGDGVRLHSYNSLQITPWDILTEDQKDKRLKEYGVSGTPYDPAQKIIKEQQDLKEQGLYRGEISGKWDAESLGQLDRDSSQKAQIQTPQQVLDTDSIEAEKNLHESEKYILPSGVIYNSYLELITKEPRFSDDDVFIKNFGKKPPQ